MKGPDGRRQSSMSRRPLPGSSPPVPIPASGREGRPFLRWFPGLRRGPDGERRLLGRSVAGQVFLLQLLIVVLLVVIAVVVVVLQARRDALRDARHRSAAAAEAFANAPGTVEAVLAPNRQAVLQPRVEAARVARASIL